MFCICFVFFGSQLGASLIKAFEMEWEIDRFHPPHCLSAQEFVSRIESRNIPVVSKFFFSLKTFETKYYFLRKSCFFYFCWCFFILFRYFLAIYMCVCMQRIGKEWVDCCFDGFCMYMDMLIFHDVFIWWRLIIYSCANGSSYIYMCVCELFTIYAWKVKKKSRRMEPHLWKINKCLTSCWGDEWGTLRLINFLRWTTFA